MNNIDLTPITDNPDIQMVNLFWVFYKGIPCICEIDEVLVMKRKWINIKPLKSTDDIGKGPGIRIEIEYTEPIKNINDGNINQESNYSSAIKTDEEIYKELR